MTPVYWLGVCGEDNFIFCVEVEAKDHAVRVLFAFWLWLWLWVEMSYLVDSKFSLRPLQIFIVCRNRWLQDKSLDNPFD